jgi:hypothetical protein
VKAELWAEHEDNMSKADSQPAGILAVLDPADAVTAADTVTPGKLFVVVGCIMLPPQDDANNPQTE